MRANLRNNEASRHQLVHLAAGELGPVAAWRLRRQIARDPDLAREWQEVRQVWTDLGQLRSPVVPSRRPEWPERRSAHGVKAPRLLRRAILAVGLIGLVSITGAVAARFWTDWITETAFSDAHGRIWHLSGNYLGKTQVLDEAGRVTNEWTTEEGDPRGVRVVKVDGFRREFRGPGRHEFRDGRGKLLGYVRLAETSDADRKRLEELREWEAFHWESLHQGAADVVVGAANPVSLPGLVAGHSEKARVSWVVRGHAKVTAVYPGENPPVRQTAASASVEVLQAEKAAPRYRAHLNRLRASVPPSDAQPQVRWALIGDPPVLTMGNPAGQENAPKRISTARWAQVRKRGSVAGYGRHEMQDENGKTVLVLEVAPL